MAELRPFRNIFSGGEPTKQESVSMAGQNKEQELFNKTGMYMADVGNARQREADFQNFSDAELSATYGAEAVQQRRGRVNQQYADAVTGSIDRSIGEMTGDALTAVGEGAIGLVEGLHAIGNMQGRYSMQGLSNELGRKISGRDGREMGAAALKSAREFIAKGYSDASAQNREAVQRDKAERNRVDKISYAEDLINNPGLGTELSQIGREAGNAFAATLDNPTELSNAAIAQLPQLALAIPARAAGAANAGAAALRSLTGRYGAAEARAILADGSNAVGREAIEQATAAGSRNAMGAFVGATEGGSAGAQAYEEIIGLKEDQLNKQSAEYREMRKAGMSHEDARRQLAEDSARLSIAIAAPVAAITGRAFSGFELNPLGAGGRTAAARLASTGGDLLKEMVEEGVQGAGSQLGQNFAAQVTGADDNRNLIEGVGDQVGTGAAVAGTFTGALRGPSIAKNAIQVPTAALVKAIGTGLNQRADARESREQAEATQIRQLAANDAQQAVQRLAVADAETAAPIVSELAPQTAQTSPSVAALPVEAQAEVAPVDAEGLDPVFNMLEQVQRAERALKSGKYAKDPFTMANIAATAVDSMRRLRSANEQLVAAMENNDEDTDVYADAKLAYDTLVNFENSEHIQASMDFFKNADDATVEQIATNLGSEDEAVRGAAINAVVALSQAAPERVTVAAADQVLAQKNLPAGVTRNMQAIRDTAAAVQTHQDKIQQLTASVRNTGQVGEQIKTEGWDKDRRSVEQYRTEALNALMAGDTTKFEETLDRLGNWITEYQLPKLAGIDAAALRVAATGKSVDVANTGTLNSTGTSTTTKRFRLHNSPGSLAQVDVWAADAQLMIDTFNTLSEFSQSSDRGQLTMPTLRSTGLTGSEARAAAVDAAMADLRAQGVNGVVDAEGFITADMSRPMKKSQKKPRVYSQQGRQLTATEVNNLRGVGRRSPLENAEFSATQEQTTETTQPANQSRESVDSDGADAAVREAQPTEAAASVKEDETSNGIGEQEAENTDAPAPVAQDNAPATPSQSDAPVQAEEEVEDDAVEEAVEETADVPFATLSDIEVPADADNITKLGARNVLKHDFKVATNANTPIGKFGAQAAATIADVFKRGLSAVRETFNKDVMFTADEMAAVSHYFGTVVPGVSEQINGYLNSIANKTTLDLVKKWQADKTGKVFAPWTRTNRKSLYATNMSKTSTELAYDPTVLEGMVLGATQYLVNNGFQKPFAQTNQVAQFLGKDEVDVSQADMRPFNEGFVQKAVIAEMANHISAALSLRADPNVTVDVSDGLPKSLAGDMLAYLQDSGVLDVRYYELLDDDKGGKTVGKLTSAGPNTAPFVVFKADAVNPFTALANSIKSARRDFNKVLNTQVSIPMWSVGAPVQNTERNISGTQQKLSRKQKKVLDVHNNIPFYFNERFVEMFEGMGRERFLAMLGYQKPSDDMNVTHREAVEGKNMSLDRAYDAVLQLVEELKRNQAETGTPLTQIPTYFDWYVTTNGRVMMNGIGPQADKLLREVLSPNKVTMDRTNPEHIRDLGLAVAQALGQKTENMTHAEVAEWIENELVAAEATNSKAVALRGLVEGQPPLEVMEQYHAEVGAPLTVREINALQTYAEFLTSNEDSLDVYLAFELDGKTDGPVNAIGQFGLWNPVAKTMLNLERGGYFFNQSGEKTINTENKRLKKDGVDLYAATSNTVKSDVRSILDNPKTDRDTALLYKRQLHLITQLGMIRTPDGVPYDWVNAEYLRQLTKQAVTSTGYAGSAAAIAGNFAAQTRTYLAQQLTAAYQNQEQISAADQAAINGLLSKKIDFSNVANYPKIQLSPVQMRELSASFQKGMARTIYSAIKKEMGDTISTMGLIVKATSIQYQVLSSEYEAAYADLLKQRIEEGKVLPHQPLSRADERSIMKSLEPYHPILQLSATQDMLSRDFGIGIVDTERNGRFTRTTQSGKEQVEEVSSMFGNRFASDVARMNVAEPGVRAAALFNIAIGDSNMMSEMFSKPRAALNVWDGYEASVGAVSESALDVNKAVYDSWAFDALGTAVQNLERTISRATERGIELPGSKLEDVVFATEFFTESGAHTAQTVLNELRGRNAAALAVKEALQSAPLSIDHMSGGMKPYTANQDAAVLPDAELRSIARKAGFAAQVNRPNNDVVGDEVITQTTEAKNTLGKADLIKMMDGAKLDATQSYIWSVVKKLLPNNIKSVYGTEEAIRDQFAQNHPDAMFPANVRGVSIGDYVYLSNTSAETTLHELTHAAMHDVLDRAYNQGGKGLTGNQKAAANVMQAMAAEFNSIPVNTMPAHVTEVFEQVQATVQQYMAEGNTYAAVSEMIAWTTNPRISETLSKRTMPKKLAQIIGNIVEAVRKLLGLSSNTNNWLGAMLSKVHTLGSDATPVDSNTTIMPLAQVNVTSEQVAALTDRLERVVAQATNDPIVAAKLTAADALASKAQAQLEAAGFTFNNATERAFLELQSAMALNVQSNPRAMALAQSLYEVAMDELSPASFAATSVNAAQAQAKYDALFNKVGSVDARSGLLGNFLGMAAVNDEVRSLLSGLRPKDKTKIEGGFEGRIESLFTRLFDEIGNVGLGQKDAHNVLQAVDQLQPHLFYIDQKVKSGMGIVDTLNDLASDGVNQVGTKLQSIADAKAAAAKKGATSAADKYIAGVTTALAAMTSKASAKEFGEFALSMANNSNLFKPLREVITELVGTTDANEAINLLINKAKYAVSHVRQNLRDQLPAVLNSKFTKPVDKETWQSVHRSIGMADTQALLRSYNAQQISNLYTNDTARQAEIRSLETQVGALADGADYLVHAKDLATVMMGKGLHTAKFFYRNAHAMSRLPHKDQATKQPAKDAAKAEPLLDSLVSLYAMDMLNATERSTAAQFLADEGGQFTLNYLQNLAQRESNKTPKQKLNEWKGNIPTSTDNRKRVVLATAKEGLELERQSWVKVGVYNGDNADSTKLSYYMSTSAAMSSFNQGAFQTAEATVSGVNALTGRTVDGRTNGVISMGPQVKAITAQKLRTNRPSGVQLLPIFGTDGEIIAYERLLDPTITGQYTKSKGNLADSIGMWEGRMVEEALAKTMNQQVADSLVQRWVEDKANGRDGEYEDVKRSGSVVVRDAWNSLPHETQRYLEDKFGADSVMIRKDMLNNTVGYRSASVRDIFTGKSDLSEPVRRQMYELAMSLMGKNAYKYLSHTESGIQAVIGQAKDIIVVRSLVVGVVNMLSNQLQLMAHGINPVHAAKIQARTLSEVNTHRKYEQQRVELAAAIAVEKDPAKRRALETKAQSLVDASRRLMIAPLIEAGELPTIAEGLTEQDEFSIISDFAGWAESKTQALPDSVITVAKWATVAKDTPLYKGMNRMVSYGDFVAKMAVYDHLTRVKGLDSKQAIREVSEEFVNYNFLPGRTRSYLESVGMTWFANYKLRIQKILLRHMRENPLRSLMLAGGASAMGIEHLFSTVPTEINYGYMIGPEPVLSAHESIIWNQLMN